MLPFLRKKNEHAQTGVIVQTRNPHNTEEKQEDNTGIHACASDLIDAVHAKDIQGVADAMKSAFDILEMQPHDEINHKENE